MEDEKKEQPHQNKRWKLTCEMSWKLKDSAPMELRCENCQGRGYFEPGGFGYMYSEGDQNRPCHKCNGRGRLDNPEREPKPEIVPDDLFELMKATWCKYFSDKGDKAWTA